MNLVKIIGIIMAIALLTIGTQAEYSDCNVYGNCEDDVTNYTTLTTNNTDYWDGLDTPADISVSTLDDDIGLLGASDIEGLFNSTACSNGEVIMGDDTLICNDLNLSIDQWTASTTYNASTIDTVDGIVDDGYVNSTWIFGDGESYNISEQSNLDFEIYINFTNIKDFDRISLRVWYEANDNKNHHVDICLWSWIDSSWDCEYHRDIPYTSEWEVLTPSVLDPENHIGTGGDDGKVWLALIHDSEGDKGRDTHNFRVDYAVLVDGFSALTNTAPPTLQQVVDANPNLNSDIYSTAWFTAWGLNSTDWSNATEHIEGRTNTFTQPNVFQSEINTTQIHHTQNITHPDDQTWGYFNNATCIVIGDLKYVSEC